MNPETFFDNFELLADTPNGVQKLRELILQLAVQGKLVPQDPNDGHAAVLLEGIKAEKARLVKEKKIRKPKKLPRISEDEKLFDLPICWEWSRLNDLGIIFNGNSVNSHKKMIYSKVNEGMPYIATKNVGYGSLDIGYDNGIKIPFGEEKFKVAHANSILICSEGGSAGKKIGIIDRDICFGNKLFANETFTGVLPKYVFYLYQSRFFRSSFNEKMTGIIGGISLFNFLSLVAPLPPLNEQRRIVAKVDQLMALCGELEARQQKKQEARLHLNSAALDRLLTAHEPDEFAHHWQRICDNFDLLYGAPETVGELRKAILQLAVQGKLVRQDENDEPAAVLLERIGTANSKMKKSLPKINKDDILYELPKLWEWMRLGEIMTLEYGKNLPKSKRNQCGEYPVYGSNGIVGYHDNFLIDEPAIIVGRKGSAGALNISSEPSWPTDVSYYLIPPDSINLNFAFILLKSLKLETLGKGIKPGVNRNEAYQLIASLPPLNEQKRIAAKADQLMALCDDLESKLKQSQTDGEKLMEAVVAELIGA